MNSARSVPRPPEWVTPPGTPRRKWVDRDLEYDNEDYESYLVDSKGNEYEPYSLAWRYLGMYIDCDIRQESYKVDETNIYRRTLKFLGGDSKPSSTPIRHHRGLGSDSNDGNADNDDNGDDCSRKVLWAAYHDSGYKGNSIGEYQFYDHIAKSWDTSTCQTSRCQKMDCHASRSKFQLIGVFKEADGLTDWAEQLFKHEGYCMWDGDKEDEDSDGNESGSGDNNDDNNDDDFGSESSDYEFMSNRQEYMSQSCYGMYLTDDDGNSVYKGSRPLPGGNVTDALYSDEGCTQLASMSFGDYIVKWYSNFYDDEDTGKEVAEMWEEHTTRWNQLMTDYHVCQPCRAYNTVPMYEENGSGDDHRRILNEDDGGGDEEQWGYNCYDDAGYRNCDQCYKFQTKTDMKPASTEDLERASSQGTILAIRVDGVTYGKGGIDWHDFQEEAKGVGAWMLGILVVAGAIGLVSRNYKTPMLRWKQKMQSRRFRKTLREAFVDEDNDTSDSSSSSRDDNSSLGSKITPKKWEAEITKNKRLIEVQRREIERLKAELEEARTQKPEIQN